MFNPAGNENHNEFIELYNAGSDPVDVSGWTLSDGSGSDIIVESVEGTVLMPGQYGIIFDPDYFEHSTIYDTIIPGEALILTIDGPAFGSRGLNNSEAEVIHILSAQGDTAVSYPYSLDNEDGFSDEKIIPNTDDTAENWGNSAIFLGTPGKRNSITPPDFDIFVTSFHVTPLSVLVNQTVTLRTAILNHGIHPPATVMLTLYLDANKNDELARDEILYEAALDVSRFAVFEDSVIIDFTWDPPFAGNLTVWVTVTGTPDDNVNNNAKSFTFNVLESENQVVINEIMYQPIGNAPEWIELFNRGLSDVIIRDWRIKDNVQVSGDYISKEDILLPQGAYIVLTGDSTGLAAGFPTRFTIITVEGFPRLNNDNDEITLFAPSGRVSDLVAYNSSWGNNPGVSLERISPHASSNIRENWGLSTVPEGATPGAANSLMQMTIPTLATIVPEPNPFSPVGRTEICMITVTHPLTQSLVTMKIFDRYGKLIRDLLRGEPKGSTFTEEWDGRNNDGRLMLTGIYVIYFHAISTNSGQSVEHKTTVVLVR